MFTRPLRHALPAPGAVRRAGPANLVQRRRHAAAGEERPQDQRNRVDRLRGTVDLQAHPVVDELSRIAPELLVTGGSFSRWLPHAREVRPGDRRRLLLTTQRQATAKCLINLLARAGLPALEPRRLASGAREWPPGYTGSVSHKGTTVAAAITCTGRTTSIGIDIEILDQKGIPELSGLDTAEHPPSVSHAAGRAILFSVKEAAFKALGRRIDFTDVAVSWLSSAGAPCMLGTARACGVGLEVAAPSPCPRGSYARSCARPEACARAAANPRRDHDRRDVRVVARVMFDNRTFLVK